MENQPCSVCLLHPDSSNQEHPMINSKAISIAIVTAAAATMTFAIPPSTQPDVAAAPATAPVTATTRPSSPDQAFIDEAAKGGLAEVTLGQLAVRRAINPEVRQFGQQMVDDHTKVNSELLSFGMD